MERQITVTSKEFDKAVGDISHAIIESGECSTDKVIAAMLFSFALFDQLFAEHGTKAADVAEAKIETFTDSEQRIFLAAMGKEEIICKQVDVECRRQTNEISLFSVCNEIKRKVKKALWTK